MALVPPTDNIVSARKANGGRPPEKPLRGPGEPIIGYISGNCESHIIFGYWGVERLLEGSAPSGPP